MLKHKREHCVFANFSVFPFSPIPLFPTLNHKPQTATGNVFLCVAASARYRLLPYAM